MVAGSRTSVLLLISTAVSRGTRAVRKTGLVCCITVTFRVASVRIVSPRISATIRECHCKGSIGRHRLPAAVSVCIDHASTPGMARKIQGLPGDCQEAQDEWIDLLNLTRVRIDLSLGCSRTEFLSGNRRRGIKWLHDIRTRLNLALDTLTRIVPSFPVIRQRRAISPEWPEAESARICLGCLP